MWQPYCAHTWLGFTMPRPFLPSNILNQTTHLTAINVYTGLIQVLGPIHIMLYVSVRIPWRTSPDGHLTDKFVLLPERIRFRHRIQDHTYVPGA